MYAFYNNEGNFSIRVIHRFTDHTDEYRPTFSGGEHGGGDLGIMKEFLDYIQERRDPRANKEAAYYSAALAIYAGRSIEAGLPVKIPSI